MTQMRKAAGVLVGFAIFGTIISLAFFAIGIISERTHSGLLGICGPYGSERALWAMVALLALGLVGAPFLGFRIARAIGRERV